MSEKWLIEKSSLETPSLFLYLSLKEVHKYQ